MKTELFLLITVIGMSFGVNSRGAVDKDITKHVKDIVIDPESSDPEANMIDGDLSTITHVQPEASEASIRVNFDGIYCIEKISIYFEKDIDESYDFECSDDNCFAADFPPDGSMISTQVQLESADLDNYKECETGIRGNAFTMDRAFKETTFNVVELVTVGVKTELLNEGGDGGDEGGDDKDEDESGDEGGNQKYSSTINKVADVALIVGLLAGLEI